MFDGGTERTGERSRSGSEDKRNSTLLQQPAPPVIQHPQVQAATGTPPQLKVAVDTRPTRAAIRAAEQEQRSPIRPFVIGGGFLVGLIVVLVVFMSPHDNESETPGETVQAPAELSLREADETYDPLEETTREDMGTTQPPRIFRKTWI